MELYSLLRGIADSWGLLAMFLFFCGVVLMLFRPGAAALHKDAANIPLRDQTIDRDIRPATANPVEEAK
ncbi:MAG: cbb3-type cytochrome c oxidase subunit 3 [Rhodobacteraceae bacterium]|nr:cbb3-type cytochrome c oxidase subunit 3 [Paracoccaceae bacterium]